MTQTPAREAPPRRPAIRPPLGRRLRSNAGRVILLAIWIAAAAAAWSLYRASPENQSVRAVAETVEYRVAADTPARIADIPVTEGDTVQAGELVAILDPSMLSRELAVLSAELELRHAELAARADELGRERLSQERSFSAAVDSAEVLLLRTRVERDAVRAELTAVRARERRQRALVSQRVTAREELDQLESERKVLTRRASLLDDAVTELERKAAEARERLAVFREASPDDAAEDRAARQALAPQRAAVELVRAQIAALEARRERRLLRAPTDGVIHRIWLRRGDYADVGQTIAVVRSLTPRRALAYLDDARAAQVRLGTRVVVADRSGTGAMRSGRVISLGAGLAPFPEQLQTNPDQPQWGREVIIEFDGGEPDGAAAAVATIMPGQILDVRFETPGGAGDTAVAAAQPSTPPPDADPPEAAPGTPRPMAVPAALRRATRIEPSALVWSPAHARFLVASDDTGWSDRHDHAPWLLGMSADGVLDPTPTVVSDIRQLNDVESLAWLDDGRLLALSSQSTSRRGRRPRSRTLLVAVEPADGGLRAVAEVSFLDALAARRDDAWFTSLGLRSAQDGGVDPRLDIEGMTVRGGDLLLGLKAPLDERGCAILWRLSAPARLLSSGRLADGQLTRHASVCMRDEARTGGVSDLLALPDGRLLVLSSDVEADGLGDDPPPGGGVWVLPKGSLAGVAGGAPSSHVTARLLRRFEGFRPEGAALTPDGRSIVVVFDRGNEAPYWTTLPLPPTQRAETGGTADRVEPHLAIQ